jgi:hypothetical protein
VSFLAPLFLLGALAVALPVLFHLVRRTTRERTVFSSLMFLRPAPPRLTRRNRLEHLLLLLLRCAVICLLAFGFARPFFKQALSAPPPTVEARRLLLLVDTSASMQRGNLWTLARERAETVLRNTTVADQLALFAFDRQLTPLLTFEEWAATPHPDRAGLARSRLAETTPGWAGSHLDLALIRAADRLAEVTDEDPVGARRQVIVISDFQSGSRLQRLQAHEWPNGVEVVLEPLPSPATSNAGLHLAAETADAPATPEVTLRVRVTNESDSRVEQFSLGWTRDTPDYLGEPLSLYVPAGQNRLVLLPLPPTNALADRLQLRGDEEPFDNTVFVLPPQPTRASVLLLGTDAAGDARQPRFFLERAFQDTRRLHVDVAACSPTAPPPADVLEAASLFVLTETFPVGALERVAAAVRAGKTLLFVPKTAADVATLAFLPELAPLSATEATFGSYGLLGELDFRHPLFAPFADPRFSDFTKIHFWKARRLVTDAVPEARVLARFDDETPALLEIPLGRGRVFLLASGWHPADSQLALSSKFVPWLYSLLDLSGVRPAPPPAHVVGDPVPLDPDAASAATAAAATVITPDGRSVPVPPGEAVFAQTALPGLYRVQTAAGTNRFAVNLDPAESRTAPLPLDELERLQVPLARTQPDRTADPVLQARLQSVELEGRQKLWRWLILATLIVLVVETWLAGRLARSPAPVTASP